MNLVILKGHLTRDPEVKYTHKGTAVAEFAIATNKTWTDQETGQKKERASFHECRAWRSTAEAIGKHFTKGRPILIQGELAQETWEDKETGKKRSKTLVLVDRFEFCGDLRKHREAPEDRWPTDDPPPPAAAPAPSPQPSAPASALHDEDIPF